MEHARSDDCPLSPGALPHHQLLRPGDQGSEEKGEGRKDGMVSKITSYCQNCKHLYSIERLLYFTSCLNVALRVRNRSRFEYVLMIFFFFFYKNEEPEYYKPLLDEVPGNPEV